MSKLVQLKRVTDRDWGRSHQLPEAMGVEKMVLLMPSGSYFARFQSRLEEQNF